MGKSRVFFYFFVNYEWSLIRPGAKLFSLHESRIEVIQSKRLINFTRNGNDQMYI